MTTQDQIRQSKLHARTLAVLNFSVGTARRDAAAERLFKMIALPEEEWPESWEERAQYYSCCLRLLRELDQATRRSSPQLYDTKLALADHPVLHFLKLLEQMLLTLNSLGQHVDNVQQEGGLLSEMLGKEVWQGLLSTCDSFARHEKLARTGLQRVAPIGKMLLEENSRLRRASFDAEGERRYAKAYAEYQEHYARICPDKKTE